MTKAPPETAQARPTGRAASRASGRDVVPLAGAVGSYGLAAAFLAPTLSLFLAQDVHAAPFLIGLFFVARGAASIGVSQATGRLSDRLRDRRVIIGISGVSAMVGGLCLALLRDYPLLLGDDRGVLQHRVRVVHAAIRLRQGVRDDPSAGHPVHRGRARGVLRRLGRRAAAGAVHRGEVRLRAALPGDRGPVAGHRRARPVGAAPRAQRPRSSRRRPPRRPPRGARAAGPPARPDVAAAGRHRRARHGQPDLRHRHLAVRHPGPAPWRAGHRLDGGPVRGPGDPRHDHHRADRRPGWQAARRGGRRGRGGRVLLPAAAGLITAATARPAGPQRHVGGRLAEHPDGHGARGGAGRRGRGIVALQLGLHGGVAAGRRGGRGDRDRRRLRQRLLGVRRAVRDRWRPAARPGVSGGEQQDATQLRPATARGSDGTALARATSA